MIARRRKIGRAEVLFSVEEIHGGEFVAQSIEMPRGDGMIYVEEDVPKLEADKAGLRRARRTMFENLRKGLRDFRRIRRVRFSTKQGRIGRG